MSLNTTFFTGAAFTSFVVTDASLVTINPNTIYWCDATSDSTYTLPPTMAAGSLIGFVNANVGNWIVQVNEGQIIYIGDASCTAGSGYIGSTAAGDSIVLVTPDGQTFFSLGAPQGDITLA